MKQEVRIGIDVGGTFTDVVVVGHQSQEVIAQLKLPTTHSAEEGVARGIIDAIHRALSELDIQPEQVVFIAHSTTQATNALLEGDVASVGVLGVGQGLERIKARLDTRIPRIELAPQRYLESAFRFFTGKNLREAQINAQLDDWKKQNLEVIVASAAFSVDDPSVEMAIVQMARDKGFLSTSGHEVSSLYGLRTRTRTAVINGAILPKMIHTATMTEACVKQAGISAPLMIMRSDGGVMNVEEVQRRPIMTMLSGPAAGIAGALMYERVSDGIFIEVGGTSADISVIRDGQPQTKSARVGGHRTYLNTLDVRTLAIAGGSMLRERNGKLIDVGSRSAHIAGLAYACFQNPAQVKGAKLVHLQPSPKDAADYAAIETPSGQRFALTPTCAANLLGIVPDTAFAKGNVEAAFAGFEALSASLGKSPEDCAREVLEISCQKVARQIEALIKEYHLDRNTLELVGGGGGAAALVLYTGQIMNLPARLAKKAEVISTIGVAMAMVRDTVERNIVDPKPEDILQVRREAAEAVINIGAVPESVEVQVEVDTRRNLVRATAFGTTELKKDAEAGQKASPEDCRQIAAKSLRCEPAAVELLAETKGLSVWGVQQMQSRLGGLFKRHNLAIRVSDRSGVIRLQRPNVVCCKTTVGGTLSQLEKLIQQLTDFGDAGRNLPDLQVLVGSRIIHLHGLVELSQVLALARTELEHFPADEEVVLLANQTL
jgi:N-methylhydantoinase A/oxoprolinase/acetone carboxylase beta subunit